MKNHLHHRRHLRFRPAARPLETRELLSGFQVGYAVYRPSNAAIYVDTNRDGGADAAWAFGGPGDQVTAGDLNGDGLTEAAVFRSGTWYVDLDRDGSADQFFRFGQAGDRALIGDVDGDGKGDLIVYRDGNAGWYVDTNRDGAADMTSTYGGTNRGDLPVVGDFNGDGRLDRAVYERGRGAWYADSGFGGTPVATYAFGGAAGDIPFVGDFNDDQFADLGIFRGGVLYVSSDRRSVTGTLNFGAAGDIPIPGAYDWKALGHGLQANVGVYNSRAATASLEYSAGGFPNQVRGFGAAGDLAVTSDFDGNTLTELTVFRNGAWFADLNGDGSADASFAFGQAGDTPLAGDVNGDGYSDAIVFRDGVWYVSTGRNGQADVVSVFGQAGDVPVAGDFNDDGLADRAVYRNGTWFINYNRNGRFTSDADAVLVFGQGGDRPFAMDFNDDGRADLGIYRAGMWYIDTSLSGVAGISYRYGTAADTPVPGFFSPANSIFVRAGAGGGGGVDSPMGSIAAALAAAPDGAIIRISPGVYNEEVRANFRSNLTFVGASRYFVNIRPASGNSFYADRSTNIHLTNVTLSTQGSAAGQGRGLTLYGATVFARGIRTVDVRNQGVYTAAPAGGYSLLDIRDSSLDRSQSSTGLFSEGGTILRVRNTTANQNGTRPDLPRDQQFGRGFVITGTTTATLDGVSGSFNNDHGMIADGPTNLLVRNSSFSFNPNANGAIINKNTNFVILNSVFESNGVGRNVFTGFNGLEVDVYGGGSGQVINSTFRGSSAYGLFLGAGRNILISGNLFENNYKSLYINGENQGGDVLGDSSAIVVGNTFRVPTTRTDDEAIIGRGGGAAAAIGGAGAKANTFINYAQYFVFHADTGNDGRRASLFGGDGLGLDPANIFINSPAPHGHES